MVLKEVAKGPSEDKYWKPAEVGDYVEGHFYKFEKGDYGKQIVLYKGIADDGEWITQTLPAHADLKRTYKNLIPGAFTKVEVVDIEKAKSKKANDKFIYKVLQDDEDRLDFDTSSNEAADDGYYADE